MFALLLAALLAPNPVAAQAGAPASAQAKPSPNAGLIEYAPTADKIGTGHRADEALIPSAERSVIRVSGEQAPPEYIDGVWRWERCAIPTALPEGYPAPTPPGAIELKWYPPARRAEVSMETPAMRSGDTGFMPLFWHITRNDIPMTAPVEMEFSDTAAGAAPVEWTMAFLYEDTAQGTLGIDPRDNRVVVVETKPVTVLSLGGMGMNRSSRTMSELEAQLESWLAENPEWRRAGRTRWFGYNGPAMPRNLQWTELQIPVERADSSETTPAAINS